MVKSRAKSSKKSSTSPQKGRISEGLAVVCIILNIVILPGLGTLIGGKTKEGLWQLLLLFGGLVLGILLTATIGAVIGIPLAIAGPLGAWIWGIVSGVQLIKGSQ